MLRRTLWRKYCPCFQATQTKEYPVPEAQVVRVRSAPPKQEPMKRDSGGHKAQRDSGGQKEKRDSGGHKEKRDSGGQKERRDSGEKKERRDSGGKKEKRDSGGRGRVTVSYFRNNSGRAVLRRSVSHEPKQRVPAPSDFLRSKSVSLEPQRGKKVLLSRSLSMDFLQLVS
jgi:hypothetical protein